MNAHTIRKLLKQLTVGHTCAINAHVVTRWTAETWEVDTWGIRVVEESKAIEWCKL